jgi:hypothetical protein
MPSIGGVEILDLGQGTGDRRLVTGGASALVLCLLTRFS